MARLSQWLCLFAVLFTIVRKIEGKINVTLTTLDSAVSKGAVCLDGSAPGYYYDKGHGEGVDKWVVFIEGGGWCMNAQHCKYRGPTRLGSSKYMYPVIGMGDMMSNTPDENPEFYNWHRVHVAYCDGSSFTSDVDGVDPVTNLTYRGVRIFDALMEDFQAKGMKNAKNAIFAGSSAGGVAVMLHCDYFRALFPNTTRVKCLADSSYFINDEKLEGDKLFQSSFDYLVDTMGSAKWLPKECTSKMKASLCFFPQYSLQYVKTPIFLTMSAFDQIQLKYGLTFPITSCITFNNCTLNEMKIAQELRMDFLSLLPKGNSNSIAIWVTNCVGHEFTYNSWYGPKKLRVIGNKTYAEVFVDWYFDRNTSPIRAITKSEKPLNCSTFEANPRQP
ncbi:pectin acetylesterase 8-like [Ipomoea triloba]|uniref:pectin acetylesterase 8-like n=1 Tax=Ipomoea triloba TaxID=35885 RepID=UPI00125D17C2|nr:pectin acetylesterase 8-like [Ipomoea triloba]